MKERPIVSPGVTIRDVAEAAGVSVSLVSFVLNARRGPRGEYICSASQQTAERIVKTAERLGYHPNKAASSLRTGRSNTIGVIVSDLSNTGFGQICRKIERLASQAGYLTIFGSSDDHKDNFRQMVDRFLSYGVDGFIVAPCNEVEETIEHILKRSIPVILFDRDLPGIEGIGRVLLDNEKAGRCAVKLLNDQGRKHIGVVRYETEITTIPAREKGCMLEARKNGLAVSSFILNRETMRRDMVPALRKALEEGADSMIFPSNTITIDGISAINELGLNIPEDLAVIGFDQEYLSEIFNPWISFVNHPTHLVAENSFNMLLDAISGNGTLETITVDPIYSLGIKLKK